MVLSKKSVFLIFNWLNQKEDIDENISAKCGF